jgi:hypothetical protein
MNLRCEEIVAYILDLINCKIVVIMNNTIMGQHASPLKMNIITVSQYCKKYLEAREKYTEYLMGSMVTEELNLFRIWATFSNSYSYGKIGHLVTQSYKWHICIFSNKKKR